MIDTRIGYSTRYSKLPYLAILAILEAISSLLMVPLKLILYQYYYNRNILITQEQNISNYLLHYSHKYLGKSKFIETFLVYKNGLRRWDTIIKKILRPGNRMCLDRPCNRMCIVHIWPSTITKQILELKILILVAQHIAPLIVRLFAILT